MLEGCVLYEQGYSSKYRVKKPPGGSSLAKGHAVSEGLDLSTFPSKPDPLKQTINLLMLLCIHTRHGDTGHQRR